MADNTKYYYMRLKESFFDSENMVLLESMPDGYLYSNILLKLYLRSLKGNGRLMLNERIPYNPQMIATLTRHQVGTVEKALGIFSELGLIEILDSGAIYMLDIQNYIGKSSTEADRQRAYQAKIASEKVSALPDNNSCKKSNKKTNKKPNLKIETKIEIETEQETETEKKSVRHKNALQYEEIILYLNNKAGTSYRANSKTTQQHINARLSEGYTVEDFKTVIDKKCADWLGTEWEQYLRPTTLFGTKFENYLNQKTVNKQNIGANGIAIQEKPDSQKSDTDLAFEKILGG